MDEKIENLIINALLNIKTNLKINLNLVAQIFGGTFDSSLPAIRKCILLGKSRYSFLIYATGEIILGNFNFQCKQDELFTWVISFLTSMVHQNAALFREDTTNREDIQVLFLIQNIAFSANFSNVSIIENKIKSLNLDYRESLNLQRSIVFDDDKIKNIVDQLRDIDSFHHVQYSNLFKKQTRFPANIVKCVFNRYDSELFKFKSTASIRRRLASKETKIKKKANADKRNLFSKQKCSFTVFSCGMVNTTGATIKQDIVNILKVLQIFNSFLEN